MSTQTLPIAARHLWPVRVPVHWQLGPLKRLIGRMESGVSVNALDQPADPGAPGVLKTSCVYTGEFDPRENKTVVEGERHLVACPVEPGALIVSRMNTPDLVGSAGLVRAPAPHLYLPDRLWQIHFNGLNPRFAHYWTQSALYRLNVQVACAGTSASMQNLSQDDFRGFPIAVPPLDLQGQLADLLDSETARIDALIEKKIRFIELLREKRQALITQSVTQGLDPNVPMQDSGVEWLGRVPAHWRVTSLRHVVDPDSTITYGIVQAGPDCDGGVPYIKTSDMAGDVLPSEGYSRAAPEIEAGYARSRVRPGDIVMSIRASIGKCLEVPASLPLANLTQGTAKIAPGPGVDRKFLLAYLSSDAAQTYFALMAKGATFKEITLEALRRTPVLLPPLNEQRLIVSRVEAFSDRLGRLVGQTLRSVELLRERRSSLITAAVTGQIYVRAEATKEVTEPA